MNIETLARPEIRHLHAYRTASQPNGAMRLHANEAPDRIGSNTLNRYPDIRPAELQARLAKRFGVDCEELLATRGSTEAIDLLIRAFCRPGADSVIINSPTFGMYRVYADIQGAEVIDCPLRAEDSFAFDTDSVLQRCTATTKLIFVCTPNNPTGNIVPRPDIIRLLEAREDQSIIVVDEAYIEFAGTGSMTQLVSEYDNLVILRTLSKALALAGARCGAVMGNAALIRMLSNVLAPYALASPVIDCVMRALSSEMNTNSSESILEIIAERERMIKMLAAYPFTDIVWPSRTNFLLVRFQDLAAIQARLQHANILIRDVSNHAGLDNCARITVGSAAENERLLAALDNREGPR